MGPRSLPQHEPQPSLFDLQGDPTLQGRPDDSLTTIRGQVDLCEMRDREKFRRECEARYWLEKYPYGGEAWLTKLATIASKRGQPAADMLRQDVREQYRIKRANNARR